MNSTSDTLTIISDFLLTYIGLPAAAFVIAGLFILLTPALIDSIAVVVFRLGVRGREINCGADTDA